MALTDNPMSLVVTGNVTGGKDYKLNLYAGAEYDTMAALIRISYSQSINNTTPSVTDYQ